MKAIINIIWEVNVKEVGFSLLRLVNDFLIVVQKLTN